MESGGTATDCSDGVAAIAGFACKGPDTEGRAGHQRFSAAKERKEHSVEAATKLTTDDTDHTEWGRK